MNNRTILLICLAAALSVKTYGKNVRRTFLDSLKSNELNASESAKIDAQAKAALLAREYAADNPMQKEMYELIYNQNLERSKLQSRYAGKSELQEKYMQLLVSQDSALNNYLAKLNNRKFIQDKIKLAKMAKPLPKDKETKLLTDFLSLTNEKHTAPNEALLTVLHQNIKDTAVYALLYKNEIKANAESSFSNYLISNNLPQSSLAYIKPVLYKQQKEIFTAYYANDNIDSASKANNRIIKKYANALDSVLFLKHINIPETLFGTALKMDSSLNLAIQQKKELLTACLKFKHAQSAFRDANPTAVFDYSPQEHEQLPKILNKEQYMAVLSVKNVAPAKKNAQDTWMQCLHYNLNVDADKDSATVNQQLYDYYLKRLVANEYYDGNIIEQKKQKAEINKTRPHIMRTLESALRHAGDNKNMQKAAILQW